MSRARYALLAACVSVAGAIAGSCGGNGSTTSVAHTATGRDFDTGPIAPGATSAPIAFSTAATFDYRCTIHPSMTGSVRVGASTTHTGY